MNTLIWLLCAASALATLAPHARAQPANDDCQGAAPISEGQFDFDLTDATNSTTNACDSGGIAVPDIWYRYTASATGTAIASTCGLTDAPGGTTVSVYADCSGTDPIACNSNACGDGQSTVSFPVTAGSQYLIRLASADGSTFNGAFSVTLVPPCSPIPGAPPNDCCSAATPIGNGTFAFTTVGATRDYTGACDQLNPNPDVWFLYTAPTTGFSKIRPESDAPQDIGITVLDGSCSGNPIACGADYQLESDVRQIVFPTVAGQTYLIRLQHLVYFDPPDTTASGHFTVATATPPANDDCDTATSIAGLGSFPYDNTLANNSGPDDAPACNFPIEDTPVMAIAHDVWFRWTSNLPVGMDAVVATCDGTVVDTKIAAYADGCPPGLPLACSDDDCFTQSRIVFTPAPGASYLIRIGNWPGALDQPGPDGKPGVFTISAIPTCSLVAPPGAIIEPEPCGQDTNGGCDTGGFTDIPCGTTTIFGTAPVIDGVQDLDYYRVTLPAASHVTFSGTAEFPMLRAILDSDCNLLTRTRVISGMCDDPTLDPLEADLLPGTYLFGVANTRPDSPCGGRNNYIITISTATCCRADFNQSGSVSVQDIFDFLAAWFDSDPSADFNNSGDISVQDIFDFLSTWFMGC